MHVNIIKIPERAITNGQSRDTANIEHKTQNEDKH
jgi:hypothetical protein